MCFWGFGSICGSIYIYVADGWMYKVETMNAFFRDRSTVSSSLFFFHHWYILFTITVTATEENVTQFLHLPRFFIPFCRAGILHIVHICPVREKPFLTRAFQGEKAELALIPVIKKKWEGLAVRFQPSGFSSDLLQGHTKQEDRQQQEEERWGGVEGEIEKIEP